MPPKKKKSGSSKSKERKLKRKQEQEEVAAAVAVVKAAYEHEDLMEGLPAFRHFKRNSLDLTVSCSPVSEMSQEDLKWAFELMKANIQSYYVNSEMGWNDRLKWEELTHDTACFLLARDSGTGKPCGFINFRFDLDDQIEVVYCYEIHLCPAVRRKGLGKFLLQILELIGFRTKMKKVVMTVFKDNPISNSFFREKMNYVDNDTSPVFFDPLNPEHYCYHILSKSLVKKRPEVTAGAAKPVCEAECDQSVAPKAVVHSGRAKPKPRTGGEDGEKLSASPASVKSDRSLDVDTDACNTPQASSV